MKTATELMEPPVSIGPEASVRELADLLLDTDADGACVVRNGRLVGVVTTMDLVFKNKRVRLPTLLAILDAVIPLGSMRDVEEEMEKIAAATVGELMSHEVVTVGPDAGLDEVATLMVEKHITVVPVVKGTTLLGVVTKAGLLAASGLASPR
jgi:CBS domain-containing protein